MAFTNNLRKGDPVLDKPTGRKGTVNMDPRATSLKVAVTFEGRASQQYVPVGDLRLLDGPKGEPLEDIPPVDGELPQAVPTSSANSAPAGIPLSAPTAQLVPQQNELAAAVMAIVSAVENDPKGGKLLDACSSLIATSKNPKHLRMLMRLGVALLEITEC